MIPWVELNSLAMPSLVCGACRHQQNVLPDECLAPPLLDAGRRLLKFLQQRFGLFSCGADDNNGGAAAASACSPVIPPPSCSYHSNDGDGAGGQMDNRRARTDPGVLSRMSNHPMDDQGVGDRGSGNDTLGAGLAGVEGLTLMQLELSEEDQPVVVPYEEVRGVMVGRTAAECVGRGGCAASRPLRRDDGIFHA